MVIAVSRWPKPIARRYLFRETLRGRDRSRPCPACQGCLYAGVPARREAAGRAERYEPTGADERGTRRHIRPRFRMQLGDEDQHEKLPLEGRQRRAIACPGEGVVSRKFSEEFGGSLIIEASQQASAMGNCPVRTRAIPATEPGEEGASRRYCLLCAC